MLSRIILMISYVTLFRIRSYLFLVIESSSHACVMINFVIWFKVYYFRRWRRFISFKKFWSSQIWQTLKRCILASSRDKSHILQSQLCLFYFRHVMYHAADKKIVRECIKCMINLLQLIILACEIRGEDWVRQLVDTCRKPVVCTSSVSSPVLKNSLWSEHIRVRIDVI